MLRILALLATMCAAGAATAQPLDVDRIAQDAAARAEAIYRREGIVGLRDAVDGCLDRATKGRTARAATTCAAMGWTMVYLDLLAIDALHVPATIDVERTSLRIAAAMKAAGLPAGEAARLRPFVVQFVGSGSVQPAAARSVGKS